MPLRLHRRQWCQATAGLALAGSGVFAAQTERAYCTLGIGTYSMTGMPVEQAAKAIGRIGYDSLEIAAMPDSDGAPSRMPASRRRELKKLIADSRLELSALMENLVPAEDAAKHREQLDRLRGVLELAGDLGADRKPLVQTVLGPGTWDQRKQLFCERLADWAKAAEQAGITLAIKPHRGGALSRPDEAIWLLGQLGNPRRLRMVYDYSHYAFRNMPLAETIRTALPYTAHVAVKDAVEQNGRVVFQLPGESQGFDYPRLFRLFYAGGYRGDFCCEVSAMVSKKAGYEPLRAAQTCYDNMSRAMSEAAVPRKARA
ncbi:MAG TPA: sugar phosphate isomerase/epimerase [Pirellulales bacterium]